MRPTRSAALLSTALFIGCGGATATTPDESADLGGTSGGSMTARIVDMPVGLDGTQWRFVNASCTEGPLDLASRGFSSSARVEQDGTSILITYDQQWANEGCVQTVMQRVSPPAQPGELLVEEVARVAVPSTSECFGQPEAPRNGEVRRNGRNMEVLVQRSRLCNGFEVTMVFEPALPSLLTNEDIARRFVAHYTRGDATRVTTLFSPVGAVLESVTTTETGDPYRHEGRDAIYTYFAETFAGADWRAMRITGFEAGETPQQTVMRWEYIDPRLAQPLTGRHRFTMAAGEIFEALLTVDGQPVVVGAATPTAPAPATP